MVDASIPLTSIGWYEWGNPIGRESNHKYMENAPTNKSSKGSLISLVFVIWSVMDPCVVAFWEPSKMAAELRHPRRRDGSSRPKMGSECWSFASVNDASISKTVRFSPFVRSNGLADKGEEVESIQLSEEIKWL
jgi:hypothetical protein